MVYIDKPPLDELVHELIDDDELMHYGVARRSGRYPWGSGKDGFQRTGDFISRVNELKKSGMKESEVAKSLGILNDKGEPSSTKLRIQYAIAKDERRMLEVARVKSLKSDGLSLMQIAKEMGYANDSSIRSLLDKDAEARMMASKATADFLKKMVDKKGKIDVGSAVEKELGLSLLDMKVGTDVARGLNISKEKLDQALERLEVEYGYPTYGGRVPQTNNPGKQTTLRVLCPPGTPHKDIYKYDEISSLKEYISRDGGATFEKKFNYPASMDSKRLMIHYGDEKWKDGTKGADKDGIVELRRGVDDLSLGESRYSQVRILVDKTHYIKGMAIYSDKMPDGVDVIFNTNKAKGTPLKKVLKEIKNDPDNPFGSSIKDAELGGQYWYKDKSGKKKLGLINKRADEGDWSDWKDKLPSQFLSKQPFPLAKRQLSLAADNKLAEYESIRTLTNPTVKKRLLQSFSDDCDSAAVHLYAAALPRQKYHVLIPITSMKDNEIYAPKYENGEKLSLIRFPHGGTFEIPELTVNNRQSMAKKLLGTDISDAVGINSKVAERLSGADFDGDTVMVIPTNGKVKIKSTPQLDGLKGFDPKTSYGTTEKDGKYYNKYGKQIKVMGDTQNQMGRISNLITDMTLRGAEKDELAKAVKHSMVVIDAEKHKLDYKSSYVENNIEVLKKRYQGSINPDTGKLTAGASTLISRAKSDNPVDKRRGSPRINMKGKPYYDPSKPEGAYIYKTADDLYYATKTKDAKTGMTVVKTTDGKKIAYDPKDKKSRDKYEPVRRLDPDTGAVTFTDKSGKLTYKMTKRTQKSTKMAETDDAYSLISDGNTPMERAYADYANKMKSLANQARKEMVMTGKIEYSASAKKTYQSEVDSLMSKLLKSEKNAPRERQAQTIAKSEVEAKKKANPDLTREEEKKIGQQALSRAREMVGAKRNPIDINDREWEAIQAGAITETKLKSILKNADLDAIRERATPRTTKALSPGKISRINSMKAKGHTISEIAKALGISPSTVTEYLK